MFQCGVPDILIQRLGDWMFLCYRAYITLSAETSLKATTRMFGSLLPVGPRGAQVGDISPPVRQPGAV